MFLTRLFLFFLLFCSIKANAQEQEDTVWLNSHQVLIGELKSIYRGIVRLDADDLEILRIQYSKIKTITTNYNEYRIELIDRNVYFGHLEKSADSGKVRIVNDSAFIKEVYIEQISKLIRANAGFFGRFTGSLGAGALYSQAEETGLSATVIGIAYQAKKTEVNLAISSMTGYTNNDIIRPRELALLDMNYYFTKAWSATAIGSYQRLLRFGVTRRFQEGLCIGNKFLQRPKMRGRILTGVLYAQEDYIFDIIPGKNLVFIPVWFQLDLFSFGDHTFAVHTDQIPMFGVSQNGRIRHEGDLIFTWEVIDNLTLNLVAYDNYDSEPPVFKNHKLDLGIIFVIGFTF